MKKILVTGAGGFIGHHLARHLKSQGHKVYGVDLVESHYLKPSIDFDHFGIGDLKDPKVIEMIFDGLPFDEVYNLAALNGSIEFTTNNKAELVHNNALINLNMAEACWKHKVGKVFFSSSACVYPLEFQGVNGKLLSEDIAYPADPDTEYGWEKLFSERVYQSYAKDRGMNIRIARFINIYGTECLIDTLKSKAPMALTKKVIDAGHNGTVDVWGSGRQIRTFCHIDDLLRGIDMLMESDITEPINLGSGVPYTIDEVVEIASEIEGITVNKNHQIDKVEGVFYRVPDLTKAREQLGWREEKGFIEGMKEVNSFVHEQLNK